MQHFRFLLSCLAGVCLIPVVGFYQTSVPPASGVNRVMHLVGAVGDGRELDVYLRFAGNKCVAAFARAPQWNKAVHTVDAAGLSLGPAPGHLGLRGEIMVRLNPDAWTPKDGQAIECRYVIHVDAALVPASGLAGTSSGSYEGKFGGAERKGTIDLRELPEEGSSLETGELDLELHNAIDADKEWKRIVAVTLTGGGGRQKGKASVELHRRGGVLLDLQSPGLVATSESIRGGFSVVIPAQGTNSPEATYRYRIDAQRVGDYVSGTFARVRDGVETNGFLHGRLYARPRRVDEVVYKNTPELDIRALVHYPPDWKSGDRRPALVYFSGGAWVMGSMNQFRPHAYYLAERGMVVVRADYRVLGEGRTMANMIEDPRSAVRWIRTHAGELGVHPGRVVVAGQSAGGQLAAATTVCLPRDASGEDPKVRADGDALILISAVVDVDERATQGDKALAREISPMAHLRKGLPPCLVIVGTADYFHKQNREYAILSRALGNRVGFFVQEGGDHGFAIVSPGMEKVCERIDLFLQSLGYLQGAATMEVRGGSLKDGIGTN